MSVIYRKSLKISHESKNKFTIGEISNLMSIDANKFLIASPYINIIWGGPIQIIVSVYLMYNLVGVSSFGRRGGAFNLYSGQFRCQSF